MSATELAGWWNKDDRISPSGITASRPTTQPVIPVKTLPTGTFSSDPTNLNPLTKSLSFNGLPPPKPVNRKVLILVFIVLAVVTVIVTVVLVLVLVVFKERDGDLTQITLISQETKVKLASVAPGENVIAVMSVVGNQFQTTASYQWTLTLDGKLQTLNSTAYVNGIQFKAPEDFTTRAVLKVQEIAKPGNSASQTFSIVPVVQVVSGPGSRSPSGVPAGTYAAGGTYTEKLTYDAAVIPDSTVWTFQIGPSQTLWNTVSASQFVFSAATQSFVWTLNQASPQGNIWYWKLTGTHASFPQALVVNSPFAVPVSSDTPLPVFRMTELQITNTDGSVPTGFSPGTAVNLVISYINGPWDSSTHNTFTWEVGPGGTGQPFPHPVTGPVFPYATKAVFTTTLPLSIDTNQFTVSTQKNSSALLTSTDVTVASSFKYTSLAIVGSTTFPPSTAVTLSLGIFGDNPFPAKLPQWRYSDDGGTTWLPLIGTAPLYSQLQNSVATFIYTLPAQTFTQFRLQATDPESATDVVAMTSDIVITKVDQFGINGMTFDKTTGFYLPTDTVTVTLLYHNTWPSAAGSVVFNSVVSGTTSPLTNVSPTFPSANTAQIQFLASKVSTTGTIFKIQAAPGAKQTFASFTSSSAQIASFVLRTVTVNPSQSTYYTPNKQVSLQVQFQGGDWSTQSGTTIFIYEIPGQAIVTFTPDNQPTPSDSSITYLWTLPALTSTFRVGDKVTVTVSNQGGTVTAAAPFPVELDITYSQNYLNSPNSFFYTSLDTSVPRNALVALYGCPSTSFVIRIALSDFNNVSASQFTWDFGYTQNGANKNASYVFNHVVESANAVYICWYVLDNTGVTAGTQSWVPFVAYTNALNNSTQYVPLPAATWTMTADPFSAFLAFRGQISYISYGVPYYMTVTVPGANLPATTTPPPLGQWYWKPTGFNQGQMIYWIDDAVVSDIGQGIAVLNQDFGLMSALTLNAGVNVFAITTVPGAPELALIVTSPDNRQFYISLDLTENEWAISETTPTLPFSGLDQSPATAWYIDPGT